MTVVNKNREKSYMFLNSTLASTPELFGLKLLLFISLFFLVCDYIMPQYFGVHIGFDFTTTRICNVIILIYLILNRRLFTAFVKSIGRCNLLIPIFLYLFVAAYTMVFRADVNSLFLVFLEMLTLYMLIYLIRYVIGVKRALIWSIRCSYFFAVEGFVEFVYGKSIFHQFLSTMPNAVNNAYRSGHYRIMGPCGHALGYGLLLILLIAISCIDIEKDEIYIFKRPVLMVMLMGNVFLTGSRSTLGIMFLELLIILLLGNKINFIKTIMISIIAIVVFGLFLIAFQGTGIGRYILMQVVSVVDQVLDTQYAANFGADVTTLQNSEEYRKVLPLIFTLDWLNPIVGRGVKHSFGACLNGIWVISIDNYYVSQYIKYAYPGLVTYCIFILTNVATMIVAVFKYKSGTMKAILVALCCYYVNLWWLDALQTLKYMYILIAIFYAYLMLIKDQSVYLERK